MTEQLLLGLSLIIVLGVGVQWLSWRLRLPSILLLLLSGFLVGPVTGLIDPDELLGQLLFPLVSIAVALILFEGGLTLRFSELPRLKGVITRLITVGALVTWVVTAVSAHFILGLTWELSILFGAILIVTGPTVIGPLLRQIRPKGKAGTAVKWEGILIDPVGAVLAVLVLEAILAGELERATPFILSGMFNTLLIGLGIGTIAAGLMIVLLSRYWIPDHLENGMTLLMVVAAFALSNWLHPESGLLTVIVMGLVLANQRVVAIHHIAEFKENLQVLLLGALFVLLAARLEPGLILQLGASSLIFLAIVVFVARPLSILLSTWGSDLNMKERLFMMWMAPRGIVAAAVSSLFAFELAQAGYEGAEQLATLTFLVIIGTVSLYGLTAGPLARRLGLSELDPQGILFVGGHELARAIAAVLKEYDFPMLLLDTNRHNINEGLLQGLKMHYGNALSEEVLEELDLTGIGRLLAMTPNNEVNSLAALHFLGVFSRADIYQLPMAEPDTTRRSNVVATQHLTGRFLFGSDITYDYLMHRYHEGAVVKATLLTEQFTYVDFQNYYSYQAIPLFIVTNRNKLTIYTSDAQPLPKPGHILISLVNPADALRIDGQAEQQQPAEETGMQPVKA